MKFCVNTKRNDSWYIGTHEFVDKNLNKIESLMFQGNGYLGIRATSEEKQLRERRNMFVSGTFDAYPGEVTELPNLPDLLNMEITIDGQDFNLKDGLVQNYEKKLNLKNGELVRQFDWIIDNKVINFKFSRFVSMKDLHLFVSKVEIMADQDINLQIRSGIDGQQSNSETQHLIEGDKHLYDGKFIQLLAQTQQSNVDMAFTVRHRAYIDEVLLNVKPFIKMNRRQIFGNYDVDLYAGRKFTLVKYGNVFTSLDEEVGTGDVAEVAINNLRRNCLFRYYELLNKSTKTWDSEIWQRSLVKIDSQDVLPQVAINFARYHLATNTPQDARMNIGAKGISGEGYKGHTFWDTEIFMLPYYIFTMPEIARNLLRYRYLGLEGAHKKAELNGYQGAQFPWEAAWPSDGETAPLWGSADIVTGKPMKIWSGLIEQHVTSDVVIAVMQYLQVTGDKDFAEKMGYEIILDAAKFWISRLEYDQVNDRYVITNVIGPDEYKEHADNNAFTNYTAHWCIQQALTLIKMLKADEPDLYAELNLKLDLDEEIGQWQSKMDKIYLPQPNDQGVIPQDDDYLTKKVIDVSKYQSNENVSDIFKDFNLDQINQLQVTKQADVMLLIYLFDELFSDETKLANWNYYESKTTHDSSLSLSTHAVLASDFKLQEKAYELFKQACEIDLGLHSGKAEKGLHLAAMGGIWNMVVAGFGGVRVADGKLKINPHLPKAWNSLEYQINWQGSLLKITIDHDEMSIENNGNCVEFVNNNQNYQIPANSEIDIKVPVKEVEM